MQFSRTTRMRLVLERAALSTVLKLPRAVVATLAARRPKVTDGRPLDEEGAAMLALDDLWKQGEVAGRSVERARRELAESSWVVAREPRSDVAVEETRVRGDIGERPARLYAPRGLASPSPLIVFFHGGGWVCGDLDTHDSWCRSIAAGARARVISVDYRRAPESRFPAAALDAMAAFRDVAARAELLGADPTRLAVMGDSAGGNLAAVVALRTKDDAMRAALQVLVYPAVDATKSQPSHRIFRDGYLLTEASIDWYLGHYAPPDVDRRHPDLSPFFAADVRGAPRALIFTAGFDPLRDEAAAYAEKLRAAGVAVAYREVPPLMHGFTMMDGALETARRATDAITNQVREALR